MNGKIFSIFVLAAIFGFSSAWFDSWELRDSRESFEDYYWRAQQYRPAPRTYRAAPPQHAAVPTFCNTDNNCDSSHCCLATPFGNQCLRKPNSIGQTCGGPYHCLSCKKGLQCVPSVSGSVVDHVSVTGTCQVSGNPESPVSGSDDSATHAPQQAAGPPRFYPHMIRNRM